MIELHPVFQALVSSHAEGWSRTRPERGSSEWGHTNGLSLVLHNTPRQWTLNLRLQDCTMYLKIPKSRKPGLGADIRPLLHDIACWQGQLDLEPMRRLSTQIGAWLLLHGQQNAHMCTLNRKSRDTVVLLPQQSSLRVRRITLPPAMIEVLQADLVDFWARLPTPVLDPRGVEHRYIVKTHHNETPRWMINLPATTHARMVWMEQSRPELNGILLPEHDTP